MYLQRQSARYTLFYDLKFPMFRLAKKKFIREAFQYYPYQYSFHPQTEESEVFVTQAILNILLQKHILRLETV